LTALTRLKCAANTVGPKRRKGRSMDEATRLTLRQVGDRFQHFSRNGRWGTCGDCPRDSRGNIYPEFCKHTDRYDHQLTIQELADSWHRNFVDAKKWVDDQSKRESEES